MKLKPCRGHVCYQLLESENADTFFAAVDRLNLLLVHSYKFNIDV